MTTDRYRCPRCGRLGEWTDGTDADYWCQVCGRETPAELCREGGSSSVDGGRSGIEQEADGRWYVWHRLLQFRAACETELDAKTVLRALRSTFLD